MHSFSLFSLLVRPLKLSRTVDCVYLHSFTHYSFVRLSRICFFFYCSFVGRYYIYVHDRWALYYRVGWLSFLFVAFFLIDIVLMYVCFFSFFLFSSHKEQNGVHLFTLYSKILFFFVLSIHMYSIQILFIYVEICR